MVVHHFLETHKRLFRIFRGEASSMLSQNSWISLVIINLVHCIGLSEVEIDHVGIVISLDGSL